MINPKGQTLIEALIALGAAVVIISAIAVVVITSVSNSDFSKYQNLATQYAQQGIDIMRSQSESDWTSFTVKAGTFCLSKGTANLGAPVTNCNTPNVDNFFVREVIITQASASCQGSAKVAVDVSWSSGKCSASNLYCHSVLLDTCLANINSVSAP